MQTKITKNYTDSENIKINYINTLEDLLNPIGNRSGMIINSAFKDLATPKKLMMVGFNPGGVPSDLMTSIKEDFTRHSKNPSLNALKERWGNHAPGKHSIQLLYQALIDNTKLESEDILKTNVYWQRSSDISSLKIDTLLEKICRKGFLLNIKIHQPKSIMFLGIDARKIAEKWSDVTLSIGDSHYPWGTAQKIRFYSMKFDGYRVKAFSIPHPSHFPHGSNTKRLNAILKAATKCDVEMEI